MEDEGLLTVSSDFGKLLRRHRLAAGLSQEALAERAQISTEGISALERGYRRRPQRETLVRLARALTLSEQQRREFEAASAARLGVPKRRPEDLLPGSGGETPPHQSSLRLGPFQSLVSRAERPIAIAAILVLALSVVELVSRNRATESSGARLSQAVTALGPFQFDVSPYVKSKVTVTPIGTLPANATFEATEGQTIQVACNEGTSYRGDVIRRSLGSPPKSFPLRYQLVIDGKPTDTYTVGSKFLIDIDKVGLTRASHTFGIDPLDTVPNSTMTFSCVAITS